MSADHNLGPRWATQAGSASPQMQGATPASGCQCQALSCQHLDVVLSCSIKTDGIVQCTNKTK